MLFGRIHNTYIKVSFMDKQFIYKLTSPSGKVYIGRTCNFEQRMIEHKAGAKKASALLVNPEIFLAPFRCLGSTYWTMTHMCNSG